MNELSSFPHTMKSTLGGAQRATLWKSKLPCIFPVNVNLSVNQTFCFIPYRFSQLMLRTAPFPMPTIVQGSSTSLFLWGWSRRVFFWSFSLSQCLSCSAWLQWTDLMIPKVLPSTLQLVRQNWKSMKWIRSADSLKCSLLFPLDNSVMNYLTDFCWLNKIFYFRYYIYNY